MSTIWENRGWVKLPPEWAQSTAKIKFELLGLGVSRGGTLWRLNAMGTPKVIIGNIADATAEITDPVTGQSRSNSASVAALMPARTGPGFLAKTKVTRWEILVTVKGQPDIRKTAERLSHAQSAVEQVTCFNRLAEGWRRHRDLGTGGGHLMDAEGTCLTCKQALAHIGRSHSP